MIRYSRDGWSKFAGSVQTRLAANLRRMKGALSGVQVHREHVDHAIFRIDNAETPTTFRHIAKLGHTLHWKTSFPRLVVELEHGLFLVRGWTATTDLVEYRRSVIDGYRDIARQFDVRRHHITCFSQGAADSTRRLARNAGWEIPEEALTVVRPGARRTRGPRGVRPGPLRVACFAGFQPLAKGILDMFQAARLLPADRFLVAVDLARDELLRDVPPNVTLVDARDRAAYLSMLDDADVLFDPIYSDGWGVVMDALARSLPIVVYGTYDKAEAVLDGESGRVVPVPRAVDFYACVEEGSVRNFGGFEERVRDGFSRSRVEQATRSLAEYSENRALLADHAAGTARHFDAEFTWEHRRRVFNAIYRQLLGDS